MQYMMSRHFQVSLQALFLKGGPFRNAADKIHAMWSKAQQGQSERTVFDIATTHQGETRIDRAVKYDLPGRARLVVIKHENVCLFLFAGSHDDVDTWLDRNRGMSWEAAQDGGQLIVRPTFVSEVESGRTGLIKSGQDLGSDSDLLAMLRPKDRAILLDGLDEDLTNGARLFGPLSSDEQIFELYEEKETEQVSCLVDVLLLLREGNVKDARSRIKKWRGETRPVESLSAEDAQTIVSSEDAVVLKDVDPVLFEHFVKTATFRDWMLYLHPAQKRLVDRDFGGSVRLAGVSGSGKTCVLIHRALRLAEKYPNEKVGLVTLNPALSRLIQDLVSCARPGGAPKNLKVSSMWELCLELLKEFEPDAARIYTSNTVVPNPFAKSEHIDEIWEEFYLCDNNNEDYDLMLSVHRTLLARGIYPREYLRQEMDFIRSALPSSKRGGYLEIERAGRVVPIERRFRTALLEGLVGWEKKMRAVGAVDAIGLVSALHAHLHKVKPTFRCLLVDEVQDLGTLELEVVRKVVSAGENDLFLCGDAAQTVHTKHHDLRLAGIELSTPLLTLRQNYRNSRQILAAAHDVLTTNFDKRSKGVVELEIMQPEHANFSSSLPMLLEAASLKGEIEHALGYLDWTQNDRTQSKKICIAICGYSLHALGSFAHQLGMPVLSGDTDVIGGKVFLSDLEQTKGFEFDTMVILNCSGGVMPHPELPPEESFRELCRLYVAMTRAKHELIVSFSGRPSEFLEGSAERFSGGNWRDYSERRELHDFAMPTSALGAKDDRQSWNVPAPKFLKYRDAVGLDATLQDELIDHVTGKEGFVKQGQQMRQVRWATVSDFFRAMPNPRARLGVISNESWDRLTERYGLIRRVEVDAQDRAA